MFQVRKNWLVLIMLVAMVLLVAGCAQASAEEEKVMGSFSITGVGEEHVIDVAEMVEQYEAVELYVTSVDSAGETNEYHIKGVKLDDVLAGENIDTATFSSLRAVASDGYAIEVPKEIVEAREIVLAYEINGEALADDSKPVRLIVPEERSMYWVRNMVNLDLIQETASAEVRKVIFLDTAVADLPSEPYVYYDAEDTAVSMTDLLSTYGEEGTEDLYFASADGLEKDETRENVELGYLKITGEERPLFLSPELPKGMHIKQVLCFSQQSVSFYSLESGFNALEHMALDKFEGIALKEILDSTSLVQTDSYLLTARDGYSVSVDSEYLLTGMIYFKDGTYRSVFPDLAKTTQIKEILSIEAE